MIVYTTMHFILTAIILLINFTLSTAFIYYSMGFSTASAYFITTLVTTYLIGKGVEIDDEE